MMYSWRTQLPLMMMMMMTVWKDWTTLKTYWYAAGFLRLTHQQVAYQSICDRKALSLSVLSISQGPLYALLCEHTVISRTLKQLGRVKILASYYDELRHGI